MAASRSLDRELTSARKASRSLGRASIGMVIIESDSRGLVLGNIDGRSRGGLTTKIHALVDALGNPVDVMLTPGQAHDLACAEPLIARADPQALIGDKAYDADLLLNTLAQRDITAVIPPKANRKTPRTCDFALYCERNLVERFVNKLKHFRAIATRYDKLTRNFLAGVRLACAIILLNRRQALTLLWQI